MITLTRDLILANRTESGSWTRAQIEALGVTWPPKSGWLHNLHGEQITEEKWREFMQGRFIDAKQLKKLKKWGKAKPPVQEMLL